MVHRDSGFFWDKTKYCLLCLHNDSTSSRLYCDTKHEMEDAAIMLQFSTYTIKTRGMFLIDNKWVEIFRIG